LAQVSTKAGFAEVCDAVGIPTPATVAVNIPELQESGQSPAEVKIDFEFPVIAKPSDSSQWQNVHFPGKLKVHELENRAELDALIQKLIVADYPGTLLVQDLIPGDETQLRSLTAYRDSGGQVTLLATGRVLLEECTPGTLGIPAAILVEPYEAAMAAATRFLNHVDYQGFANFDFKRDSRTGEDVFFEVNPRIGRNNYYVTGAGANVAQFLVEDRVLGKQLPLTEATEEVLYSVVPFDLLRRYITDQGLLDRLARLQRAGSTVNPLRYSGDNGLRRRLVTEGIIQNYRRKFAKYHPSPNSAPLT
jgi:predicted ATP-grasp superfamily ATP-dependent carboligase